jgi:NH3-dependent NAD+ synthetase
MNYDQVIALLEEDIKNYLGNRKAIIGISGGIDSAVVATLCSRALGKENVFGVMMPYDFSANSDAFLLVEHLDIPQSSVLAYEA